MALLLLVFAAPARAQWQTATPQQLARDASAFQGLAPGIEAQFQDVQSVVVALRGRVVFEYFRDGEPDRLRDVQSVAKSAVSALVGTALQQGLIGSLDQPVLALLPEWAPLNSDPRARHITLRHLLTMTAGFQFDDPTGTAAGGRPSVAWARPIADAPGTRFAYDNAAMDMLVEILKKVSGLPLAELAQQQLVAPLGMARPATQRGLFMRTEDMARLGQLFLQNGRWGGQQRLSPSFVAAATSVQNSGGPPVNLSYGFMWWVVPSKTSSRPTFLASGYGGQFIWVFPAMELVVAVTSDVSPQTLRRGQALKLMRTRIYAAAQRRLANEER